jgi:hypothetical protein
MKQKFMVKDGVRVEVADNGSVEAMQEAGWKIDGDAPDQVTILAVAEGTGGSVRRTLPAMFMTADFLNKAVMSSLPATGDAVALVAELRAVYDETFTQDHEDFVLETVKPANPDDDLGDNKGVDEKYKVMPVKQLKELMDAKGLAYKPGDSKAKLVEILKASNPDNAKK